MKKSQLREKIRELENELDIQSRRHVLELDKDRFTLEAELRKEYEDKIHSAELAHREFQTAYTEIEKRWDSSAYKQLSDILKALVVKLPTLEIKELHAHSNKK